MLSVKELKTLIKAHNKLSQIKIPPRATLAQLEKLVEDNGYKVDHEKKALKPGVKRGKQITLKKAEEITKPKPKTELQKQKEKELKEQKAEKEKKKIREAKKEAVEKFKKGQQKKESKKPVKKPMKKEDEVRPKEKVGRPKVDPKKIKVIEPKKKSDTKLEINFRSKKQKEIIKNPTSEMVREAIKKQYPDYSDYDRFGLINLVKEGMEKGKVGSVEVLEKKNAGKDLQIQQNLIGTRDYGKRIILKKKKPDTN